MRIESANARLSGSVASSVVSSVVRDRVRIDRRAERDDAERDQHRREREDRREREQAAVDVRRDEVLLEDHLQGVGDEVKDALQLDRADVGAVRTEAVLHHRALPALGPREQRRERHHEREDQEQPLRARRPSREICADAIAH